MIDADNSFTWEPNHYLRDYGHNYLVHINGEDYFTSYYICAGDILCVGIGELILNPNLNRKATIEQIPFRKTLFVGLALISSPAISYAPFKMLEGFYELGEKWLVDTDPYSVVFKFKRVKGG